MKNDWAHKLARAIIYEYCEKQPEKEEDDKIISRLVTKKKRKKKSQLDPMLENFIDAKTQNPDADCEAPFWLQTAIEAINFQADNAGKKTKPKNKKGCDEK